jgi:hypothetical protein
MKNFVLIAALFICAHSDLAASRDTSAVQLSVAAGNVAQQRIDIERKLTQVEYTELDKDSRIALNQALDSLESGQLAGSDSLVAENKVNGILTKAFNDSKMVCTFEQPLGSNMKKRTCMTAAAKKKAYDNTRKTLDMQKTPSNPYGSN